MTDSDNQPTILVTGSTGLICSQLVVALEKSGHRVLRAVRREVRDPETELFWNPAQGEIDRDRLVGVDGVIHLAGANIAGRRWSTAYKKELIDSRVNGTKLLAEAIANLEKKPRVFACASAIGFYGDRDDAELDETATSGDGFLPELCMQWERACQPVRDAGIRVVNMRTGVVLSPDGGALAKMLTPFKLGVGGIIGSGRQYFSWIAIDDMVRAIQFVAETDSLSGPVNLVAPRAVTNREFTKTLGRVLSRPTVLPMPAMAARLAFGEMADALLLASARVVPTKLSKSDFQFCYPTLEPALEHLLEKSRKPSSQDG